MSRRKTAIGEHALPLGVTGVFMWLVGALIVRSAPTMFQNRWWLALAFLLMPLIVWTLLALLGTILNLERPKRLGAASLLAAVALTCHGIALVWWPTLYGTDDLIVRHGAAWFTYTFAVVVGLAWYGAE
jgi:uncharacterized membrane protein YhdT